jgi:hypothetical protein
MKGLHPLIPIFGALSFCPRSSNILQKIKDAVLTGNLTFKPFFSVYP